METNIVHEKYGNIKMISEETHTGEDKKSVGVKFETTLVP